MGTKAIFKIYRNGKFLLGSWIKFDGGASNHGVFPYVMKNVDMKADDGLKYHFFKTINDYVNLSKFTSLTIINKKKPFLTQVDSNGMTPVDVLFWDTNLSEKKLIDNDVWAEIQYELRITKNDVKVKVDYNGNINTFKLRNAASIHDLCKEVFNWIDDVDYGLNDCDCGK